jgi:uncharacterized protein (DUF3820 family)
MDDNSRMPFGKHKNEKLANVPADYLIWLHKEGKCFGELKNYIDENMDVLKDEIEIEKKAKK